MFAFTVTISDHTKPGLSLWDLVTATQDSSTPGYTIKPTPGKTGGIPSFQLIGEVSFLLIQAGTGNSSGIIYVGDSNTANDGTLQGCALAATAAPLIMQASLSGRVSLKDIYVRGNTDTNTFNFMFLYA